MAQFAMLTIKMRRNRQRIWRVVGAAVAATVLALAVREYMADPERFVGTALHGLTLGALFFIVASGFTLVFGVLRVVNMAHGSFYLLGGYIAWNVMRDTGNWPLALLAAAAGVTALGVALHQIAIRRVHGQPLREALVTIGLAIILADLMIAQWGGAIISVDRPTWLDGRVPLLIVDRDYPIIRLGLLGAAIVIGLLLWLLIERTRAGMAIRAAVDDRNMLSALGVNVQRIYVGVFALGALLAGIAGVAGGSLLALQPGEDGMFLLFALVVVILGGMGSLAGAALAAAAVGLTDQFAALYHTQFSVLYVFLLMVIILAVRPQGIFGRAA